MRGCMACMDDGAKLVLVVPRGHFLHWLSFTGLPRVTTHIRMRKCTHVQNPLQLGRAR